MAQSVVEITSLTGADALIARYIEPNEGKPGRAFYSLKEEHGGYAVWLIIGALILENATPEETMRSYEISREAFDAVLVYYLRNREYIDAWLLLNRADG